ncbi:MAG: formate dehydrogenase accessory sulfurtransferase FdhD [Betaproteobacteria bacterium]|jgi:FdhD protein
MNPYRPQLSHAASAVTHPLDVIDECGRTQSIEIPGERPLTIYLDKKELVTLMTIGGAPEALVLGYLRNQRLVNDLEEIDSIQVDWETESAAVKTKHKNIDIEELTSKRTVTTGCGQGTVFGDFMTQIDNINLPSEVKVTQSALNQIVEIIRTHPSIYKRAGSVHACAVFRNKHDHVELVYFIEDVGRHNAVDAISGMMWLEGMSGGELIFYTTGRLTSEMVIKGGQMGIPFLMTRSGATQMALELSQKINLTILTRCSGKHFLVYQGAQRIIFQPTAVV